MTKPENQTLVEHIEALRAMLLHCVAAVLVALPVGLAVALPGIWWLIDWTCPPSMNAYQYLAPMEVFIWQMKFALVAAVVVASPYMYWSVWRFIGPALYAGERRALKWWIAAATLLFIAGVALSLGMILPLVMRFGAGFQSPRLVAALRLDYVFGLAQMLALAFGVMFQFPLVVLMLVRFGVVKVKTLAHARPYIVVGLLILAAILTPPDIVSQAALALPSWLLFEAALLAARRFEKRAASEAKISDDTDYGFDLYNNDKHPPGS